MLTTDWQLCKLSIFMECHILLSAEGSMANQFCLQHLGSWLMVDMDAHDAMLVMLDPLLSPALQASLTLYLSCNHLL